MLCDTHTRGCVNQKKNKLRQQIVTSKQTNMKYYLYLCKIFAKNNEVIKSDDDDNVDHFTLLYIYIYIQYIYIYVVLRYTPHIYIHTALEI